MTLQDKTWCGLQRTLRTLVGSCDPIRHGVSWDSSPGGALPQDLNLPAASGCYSHPRCCPNNCNLNKPAQFSVLLGAWQLGNPGLRSQEVGIAWVQPHPVYSWKEGSRADIALVRLEHSIQFSERVLPICLPDSSVRLLPDTNCWIAGWGSINDGVPLPHPQTLQKLKVPIIDSGVCSRLYWRGAGQGAITEDMLCAGYLEGERDACLGDSGGPLMCQVEGTWLLAGIISWGEGCAERNRPGVYISLAAHRSWVQRIVQGVQLRGHSQGSGPAGRRGRTLGSPHRSGAAGSRRA
ncbi:brain-specific serine protease 4 isoform X1 [Vicugna pacos]|uniref:Brain-specific serine protease 4 isoform X1 n=1 Tax=Vicugna pacos TaxID=30538 RepID=A0ABM5BQB6_VICPA